MLNLTFTQGILSIKFAAHERITTAISCYVTHKHRLVFIKKKQPNVCHSFDRSFIYKTGKEITLFRLLANWH